MFYYYFYYYSYELIGFFRLYRRKLFCTFIGVFDTFILEGFKGIQHLLDVKWKSHREK